AARLRPIEDLKSPAEPQIQAEPYRLSRVLNLHFCHIQHEGVGVCVKGATGNLSGRGILKTLAHKAIDQAAHLNILQGETHLFGALAVQSSYQADGGKTQQMNDPFQGTPPDRVIIGKTYIVALPIS